MKTEVTVERSGSRPLVSIIVDNYNYAQYLPEAIDSALAQDYARLEVIVVDDGSTDESREVMASYGDRITRVLKSNGGQASALNAGFRRSSGDIVLFLDADDVLFPKAVTTLVRQVGLRTAKVHWPLKVIDSQGRTTGKLKPGTPLPEGDLCERLLRTGISNCGSPPTSGNAWARWFLERVMPIPEDVPYYRMCADEYLFTLAPAFGLVSAIHEPQGLYRIHGKNMYSGRPFRETLDLELAGYDQQVSTLTSVLRREGFSVDQNEWRSHSWFHKLERSRKEVSRTVRPTERFILVDDDTWAREQIFELGRARPFLEKNGEYWGAPADDKAAVEELERLRAEGAAFIVFAWPAFWWLDHYTALRNRLQSSFPCSCATDDVIIYDLRTELLC